METNFTHFGFKVRAVASGGVSGLLCPNTDKESFSEELSWSSLSPSLTMEPSQLGFAQFGELTRQGSENAARLSWSQNLEETGGGITLNLYPALLIGSIVTFFFLGTFLNVPVFNISADIISKIFWGEGFGTRTQDFIDSYARADTKYGANNVNTIEWGPVRQYERHMGRRRAGGWERGVAVASY